ncbi:MAG: cytochrome D1 domain-containing protein [Deltaproteobacteria bacterium]
MGTIQATSIRKTIGKRWVPAGIAFSLLLFIAVMPWADRSATAAPAGKVYVGLFKENAVAVIDASSNRVLRTIPIPPGPHGLVITPDGRKVYVSSDGASTVSVIDTSSDRIVNSIEVGKAPHGLSISQDGSIVLAAAFGADSVALIDTETDQVVGRVPVPQPHNSTISPDGNTAYVASQRQGETALVRLDLVKRSVSGSVPLDKTPRALGYSPDGKEVYFTVAGDDAVLALDPSSNRVIARVPVGASPHHPLFTPDGRSGLVVSQGPGTLEILDPVKNSVKGTVKVGSAPHWIAASSDSRTAYVTNETSNDVSVVDLDRRAVVATIPVGAAPRKIAVQPVPAMGRTVKAGDYYFKPASLNGKPGQRVTLTVENETATLHNVSIPELHIDKDIPPKGKVDIEVAFPRSGTVRFFCKFHSAIGMKGELLAANADPSARHADLSSTSYSRRDE